MDNYRYALEGTVSNGRKILANGNGAQMKHYCNCNDRKKKFVRYVDTVTGEYLPACYGRCDRDLNCGYHVNPYNDGYARLKQQEEKGKYSEKRKPFKPKTTPTSLIPHEILKGTRKGYERNSFIQNLLKHVKYPFEVADIKQVISLYNLGTVCKGYRSGAVTFPFIDYKGRVRAIQVKKFDKKNSTMATDYIHSIIGNFYKKRNRPLPDWLQAYLKNDKKVSCLFGAHLLAKHQLNPVALVEAPKTAIYATLYYGFPDNPENLLWLAVYNLTSLNVEKCKDLKGRNVILFPDLSKPGAKESCYELWSRKAVELEKQIPNTCFKTNNLLETIATEAEKIKGLDLADYLIERDWRAFRKTESSPQVEFNTIQQIATNVNKNKIDELKPLPKVDQDKPFSQNKSMESPILGENNGLVSDFRKTITDFKIRELESFFKTASFPAEPIKINDCCTIADAKQFVRAHLAIVNSNQDKRVILPYLDRLDQLKRNLENLAIEGTNE